MLLINSPEIRINEKTIFDDRGSGFSLNVQILLSIRWKKKKEKNN